MVRSTLFRGVVEPKIGPKNESSRNFPSSIEIYISKHADSEYPTLMVGSVRSAALVIPFRLGFSDVRQVLLFFEEDPCRTGGFRIAIRNQRGLFHIWQFSSSLDPLTPDVTGTCWASFFDILRFSKNDDFLIRDRFRSLKTHF